MQPILNKFAVKGSRITYKVASTNEIRVGTVCGFERVGEKGNRSKVYRIAEDANLVPKDTVISVQSPKQIKDAIVQTLLSESVLENIELSVKEVSKHEFATAKYLPPTRRRQATRIGGVRI